MRSWKRLLFYLLLNVIVSAVTILTVITLWERNQMPENLDGLPEVIVPGAGTGSLVQSVTPQTTLAIAGDSVYTVQFGDTLASIALLYGVTSEAIMQVNGLSSPNEIGVGQELIIPGVPVPETGQGGEGESPVYSMADPQLQIVAVIGVGDLPTERVAIKRIGENQLSMAGWRLQGGDGVEYLFPSLVLYKDASVNLRTTRGVDTVSDLYWGLDEPVWKTGDKVTIWDPQGNLHVEFVIP
jgi:LysM repeat protein